MPPPAVASQRMDKTTAWLARQRVRLGFVAAALALILARPAWGPWRAGLAIALVGESMRIWAAGYLEKGSEVTRSGPYRFVRHPLYAGSVLIAFGVVIAAGSLLVTLIAGLYVGATIGAAVKTEEAFLRSAFGTAYDEYAASRGEVTQRRFSVARALRNREHRAIVGLLGGFALLALKMIAPI